MAFHLKKNGLAAAIPAALLVLTVSACDDATGPDGFATSELTAELAITPDHVHIYESDVTFTVSVVDPDGHAVTDFEVVQVEYKLTDAASWSTLEATRDGDFYLASKTFETSGEYDIRVTGLRADDSDLVVLYEAETPLHAVRAHSDVGGYRVEGEPDPGHIHQGNAATVRFWILDDATGAGIAGLTPIIRVQQSGGGVSEYDAVAGADGLYTATHTFTEIGTTLLTVQFVGSDDQPAEWTLEIEVHAAH